MKASAKPPATRVRSVSSRSASTAVLLLLLAGAAAAYWPGLRGDFLFDDYPNLAALGRYGGVRDWNTLLWYLTSGIADPTGRPVSMLSFLIDARTWPADPWTFKRTNLLLHLANAGLLYALLVALGRRLLWSVGHARAAALVATSLWLLHPLWVSTVLYVIQRQAMLAMFFALLGLLAWLSSTHAFESGRARLGWCWALLAMPVCGTLAVLSKANGALLPLLILALQVTVIARHEDASAVSDPVQARRAKRLLVELPAACVLLLLAVYAYSGWQDGDASRGWTLGQRLLSQPRALFDYLHRLWIPGLEATGVFADAFPVSSNWQTPMTTLPATAGLLALVSAAWLSRKKLPAASAAVLFFVAGHAMESGPVMLELYFEHRNYLPAALMFWPLAHALLQAGPARLARRLAAVACLLLCALITASQAQLWADPSRLSTIWAAQLPQSPRAQIYAASMERSHEDSNAAMRRLAPLVQAHPDNPLYVVNWMDLRCAAHDVSPEDLERTTRMFAANHIGDDIVHQWLTSVATPGSTADCAGLTRQFVHLWIGKATQQTTPTPEQLARSARLRGLAALGDDACVQARNDFDRAIASQPRPEFLHQQTILLATHCSASIALSHLDRGIPLLKAGTARASSPALRLRDRLMQHAGFWESEWVRLRQVLVADEQRGVNSNDAP